jgi:hypothetical protein
VTERSAADWQVKGGIDYDNAEKLAEILEVDVDYIWRGPAEGDRAPSPFAGQDAVADRLDAIQQMLEDARSEREQHAAEIQGYLKRQDAVLRSIEDSIKAEEAAKAEAEDSRQRLLQAAEVARRILADASQRLEAERGTPAK